MARSNSSRSAADGDLFGSIGSTGWIGDGFGGLGYEPLPAPGDVCAFARGSDVVVAVPVRVDAELLPPDALGVPGPADAWTDLLAPLDAIYGRRRPAVFERVP